MKAHLLHPTLDLDWEHVQQAAVERTAARTGQRRSRPAGFNPHAGFPWNAEDLERDLALIPLLDAMARGDDWVFEVSRRVLLEAVQGDLDTILYRQCVLADCLRQPAVVRHLYALAVEATEPLRGHYLGVLSRYPDWVLRDSRETMTKLLGPLRKLRDLAEFHARHFGAQAWTTFFAMVQQNLGGDYLTAVERHLHDLTFPHGLLFSAELGPANKGTHYRLHRTSARRRAWIDWWKNLFEEHPATYRFELSPRDEAGVQALAELRNRATASAADALGQAANHVRDFFTMLRAELAFYIGCLNLHESLTRKGYPTSLPLPSPASERRLSFQGLHDVTLALTLDSPVVPNDLYANRKNLLIITGPNSGGKSTFLRTIGTALLMMQAGMIVPVRSFHASLCRGLFTHFKREEDVEMRSGKFDEELRRMSEIIDHVRPDSVILLNESFAATNEREGSEIARQVLRALADLGVRIVFVTHLFDLARSLHRQQLDEALFLRAERLPDGRRTYRILEGEPLATSHGEDVYRRVFGMPPSPVSAASP
ncbi:MAG: DNA mismatch repair protein MutS [Armatimonadota bacterium]|nr:DNA mismatch repair protein MutS [Armatimonadota bacterium]